MLSLGVVPSPLERKIRGVDLTSVQYDEYQWVAGRLVRATLVNLVSQPGWQDVPAWSRKKVVAKAIDRARARGRTYMLMARPEIISAATAAKLQAVGLQ